MKNFLQPKGWKKVPQSKNKKRQLSLQATAQKTIPRCKAGGPSAWPF